MGSVVVVVLWLAMAIAIARRMAIAKNYANSFW